MHDESFVPAYQRTSELAYYIVDCQISGIASGLNFYLLPMTLSLSWAILGINREQLNTRFFDQRIADVFCLSCNFGCLQSQKQVNERISFLSKFATWLYSNCDSVKKLVVKHSICQEIKSMDLVGICSLKVLKRHIWQLLDSLSAFFQFSLKSTEIEFIDISNLFVQSI